MYLKLSTSYYSLFINPIHLYEFTQNFNESTDFDINIL